MLDSLCVSYQLVTTQWFYHPHLETVTNITLVYFDVDIRRQRWKIKSIGDKNGCKTVKIISSSTRFVSNICQAHRYGHFSLINSLFQIKIQGPSKYTLKFYDKPRWSKWTQNDPKWTKITLKKSLWIQLLHKLTVSISWFAASDSSRWNSDVDPLTNEEKT